MRQKKLKICFSRDKLTVVIPHVIYAYLKGPTNSKNGHLYFLAPAQTILMKPILVSCEAPFRSNLQKKIIFTMRRPFKSIFKKKWLKPPDPR